MKGHKAALGSTRPISRELANELTDSELDLIAGASCGIYTQTCTRTRDGQNVDCGAVNCDDGE